MFRVVCTMVGNVSNDVRKQGVCIILSFDLHSNSRGMQFLYALSRYNLKKMTLLYIKIQYNKLNKLWMEMLDSWVNMMSMHTL